MVVVRPALTRLMFVVFSDVLLFRIEALPLILKFCVCKFNAIFEVLQQNRAMGLPLGPREIPKSVSKKCSLIKVTLFCSDIAIG